MFGICKRCQKDNAHVSWCKSCDPMNSIRTGNNLVDDFLQKALHSANRYEKVVEWIPYDRLKDIKMNGRGGFGKVFSAMWMDGKRISIDENGEKREKELKVALKMLEESENISGSLLKKIMKEVEFQYKYSSINLYGLTQDPATNNYIMVLKFADSGNLHEYIIKNFETFNWKKKLFFLERISNELILIHKEGNVHRDFHHGNILIHDDNYPCISDLGLAGPANAAPEGNEIYGVLPYVAPEVLYGKQYTAAADIYSFGVIMTEISSGKPPHGGVPHDTSLAIEISNGLRPKFGRGTPKVYIDLAYQCMDADSSKRPTASKCFELLSYWCDTFRLFGIGREKDAKIRDEFRAADNMNSNPSSLQKHSDAIYTSRLLSQHLDLGNIPEPKNSIELTATPDSEYFILSDEESPNE